MATIKQIDANRRNALRSTGPRTQEGKQQSSQNALQSGIYAEKEVLPFEDATKLETLIAEYHERFRPPTPEARALVDSLVHHEWLLRRLRRAEAAIYECDCKECTRLFADKPEPYTISGRLFLDEKKFDHLQRRINATERNYHRSLKALQALEPPPEPAQPEDPKPTSTNLASFPQNDFLGALSGPASAPSAINPEPPLPEPAPQSASFPQQPSPLAASEPESQPGPIAPPEQAPHSDSCLLAPDSPSPEGTSAPPAPYHE
jgi:hypothetical protein